MLRNDARDHTPTPPFRCLRVVDYKMQCCPHSERSISSYFRSKLHTPRACGLYDRAKRSRWYSCPSSVCTVSYQDHMRFFKQVQTGEIVLCQVYQVLLSPPQWWCYIIYHPIALAIYIIPPSSEGQQMFGNWDQPETGADAGLWPSVYIKPTLVPFRGGGGRMLPEIHLSLKVQHIWKYFKEVSKYDIRRNQVLILDGTLKSSPKFLQR